MAAPRTKVLRSSKKYEPWLAYWVSEKDKGQSHAINKGLARATGELFNWINSDDLLLPGALAAVGSASRKDEAIAGRLSISDRALARSLKTKVSRLRG
jgi:GT2 family glycosyltransferase